MSDEVGKWFEHEKKNIEALAGCPVMAAIVTPKYLQDPQCMLQIGAAILMNKPIALIVMDGCEIPAKLRGVADRVIRCKRDDMGKASAELAEFVKTIP